MSEQTLLPPTDEAPESLVKAPIPRRNLVPWLYGLGFLILAVAIFYLWRYPSTAAETADRVSARHAVEQRLADIDAHVNRLDASRSAETADSASAIHAVEQRLGP